MTTALVIVGAALVIFAGCIAWMAVLLKRVALNLLMAALDGAAQDIWQA